MRSPVQVAHPGDRLVAAAAGSQDIRIPVAYAARLAHRAQRVASERLTTHVRLCIAVQGHTEPV